MKLDNNYSIKSDSTGAILTFQDERTREKDGKEVPYTFKDQWYFVSVEQALRKYLELKIDGCEDARECLDRIEEVKQIILDKCKEK